MLPKSCVSLVLLRVHPFELTMGGSGRLPRVLRQMRLDRLVLTSQVYQIQQFKKEGGSVSHAGGQQMTLSIY
jgi:hypothetical protein